MQEFNKISTTSNFIKQLLSTTYLPVVRTVMPGDYIIENRIYIYRCEIIECKSSGYLLPYAGSNLSPQAKFIPIGEYTFGDKNGKLCKNYQSISEGYDSRTHEKLGEYLRALRDMYGLNLMPLYNCFSNNPLSKYHIFTDRIVKTSYDYHTKIYKVPIRFNTDYTICIENLGSTTFAPAFIRNENLIKIDKTAIGDNIDVTNRYISLHSTDVISTYSGLRFFDPIVIRFNNIPETVKISYQTPIAEAITYPIKIELNKYFTPIEILNTEDFHNYLGRLYKKAPVNENNPLGLTLLPTNAPFGSVQTNSIGIYYLCKVNPKELNWYEEGSSEITTDELIDPNKSYYTMADKMSKSYYVYNIEDVHCEMYDSLENTLYLLIQVPESFESNIVILEGDYRNINSKKYFNEVDLRDYPENYLDKLFTHDLRLMRMNVPQIIPFSDTLIQFLLWNAICSLDTINLDMDRLLLAFRNLYTEIDDKFYANYWYFRYRELISDYARENLYMYIDDNLGYVTSEIEDLLSKGKEWQ